MISTARVPADKPVRIAFSLDNASGMPCSQRKSCLPACCLFTIIVPSSTKGILKCTPGVTLWVWFSPYFVQGWLPKMPLRMLPPSPILWLLKTFLLFFLSPFYLSFIIKFMGLYQFQTIAKYVIVKTSWGNIYEELTVGGGGGVKISLSRFQQHFLKPKSLALVSHWGSHTSD